MKLSRRAASVLTLLLLIVFSVLGAEPYILFGLPTDSGARIGIGFERHPGLFVVAQDTRNRGLSILNDPVLLRQTGGGMMVSTAEPSAILANKVSQLKNIPSNEDGRRFQVTVGKRVAYLDLFDWEAKPLVEFVARGHHGVVSAKRYGDQAREFTLDDAFQERLLGLRFIQADILPRGIITSQTYLPRREDGNLLLGNGEREWLGTKDDVEAAMKSIAPLLQDRGAVVLTDAGVRFVFSIVEDRIEIQGNPYYFFWSSQGSRVQPIQDLNEAFRTSWSTLKRANPLVIRAVERAFRGAAFFRYQQEHNPRNWKALILQVSRIPVPLFPTPRRLEKVSQRNL